MTAPIEVSCRDVKDMLDRGDNFLFLDCREREEHATAHIAAAELLPMSEIVERVGELEPHRGKTIVVHCHHGGRSLRVANWLRGQGYDTACSMAGGIDDWSQTIDATIPRY